MTRRILFACEVFLLAAWALSAQTLDTGIQGTVTDPSGAVVTGAAVTITNDATGISKTATTDTGGRYEIGRAHV